MDDRQVARHICAGRSLLRVRGPGRGSEQSEHRMLRQRRKAPALKHELDRVRHRISRLLHQPAFHTRLRRSKRARIPTRLSLFHLLW